MTEEARFTFGPRPKTGYAGLTPVQVASLVAGAVLAVTVMNTVGGAPGLPAGLGVLALVALLVFTRRHGLSLVEWVPVLAARTVAERRWLSSAPTPAPTTRAWPRALGKVAWHEHGGAAWAVDAGAVVGLLDVSPPVTFTLGSSHTRAAATDGWASTLAGLAEPGSLVEAVSWTVRVGQADQEALTTWAGGNFHPGADEALSASYAELLAAAGPVGQQHTRTLAVRLRPGRATERAAKLAGGTGALITRELWRIAAQLADVDLRAEPIASSAGVRTRVVSHLDPRRRPAGALLALSDQWDHVRLDDVWARVLWAEEFPSVPVPADFLAPLLVGCRSPRVVTLTARPVPSDDASSTAERRAGGQEADAELLVQHGVRLSARRRKALGASQEREEELASGSALLRFTALVAVLGTSRTDLEDATAEVVAAGATCRLRLRVLYGRQAVALGTVLPLARGVSR